MKPRLLPTSLWGRITLGLCVAAALVLVCATVRFNIKGHFDGIFILKGTSGWRYELKDDLYVGDGDRVLWSLDFDDPSYRFHELFSGRHRPGEPYLYYEWDEKDGSGFFRNFLGDGSQILTCFGRYHDDDHLPVHGLFVGGGLPPSVIGGDNAYMDETGMAYFDGNRWYHLWCNVNEGIISGKGEVLPPPRWRFLGSRVIDNSTKTVVVASSHEVEVDGVPLRIDRYVYLNAGDTYFVLQIKVTNIGDSPARYHYLYGDEPWVGNYGSSRGNVGWVRDSFVKYATTVDTTRYSWAGFYDFGNEAAGEEHQYTGKADFIEWFGANRPVVYFSNASGDIEDVDGSKRIPLKSDTRFLGLQWEGQLLNPRQSATYTLAVGMAGHDPRTGFPVKPEVKFLGNK
jgi:hypothetical protein